MRRDILCVWRLSLEELVNCVVTARASGLLRGRRGRWASSKSHEKRTQKIPVIEEIKAQLSTCLTKTSQINSCHFTSKEYTYGHIQLPALTFVEATICNWAISPFDLAFVRMSWQRLLSLCEQKQTLVDKEKLNPYLLPGKKKWQLSMRGDCATSSGIKRVQFLRQACLRGNWGGPTVHCGKWIGEKVI